MHPSFNIRKAENVYGTGSNLIGDSSPPCGYVKCKVESGEPGDSLKEGEFNKTVDAFWFGTRFFVTEPLIVPKQCSDPDDEEEAYLLGMVHDAARDKDFPDALLEMRKNWILSISRFQSSFPERLPVTFGGKILVPNIRWRCRVSISILWTTSRRHECRSRAVVMIHSAFWGCWRRCGGCQTGK